MFSLLSFIQVKVNSSELNWVLSFGALGKAVFEQERKLAGFAWNRRVSFALPVLLLLARESTKLLLFASVADSFHKKNPKSI